MKVFLFGVTFGEAILGDEYLTMTSDELRSVIDHYGLTVVRLESGQFRLIDLTNDKYTVVPDEWNDR